jgi:hypothetical protein
MSIEAKHLDGGLMMQGAKRDNKKETIYDE